MGGHGGLNILPQKSWNVYNFDNRERVRKDEEEAARKEQALQQKARQAELEFKLGKLREIAQAKRRRLDPPGASGSLEVEGEGAIVARNEELSAAIENRSERSNDAAERPQFINLFAEYEEKVRKEGSSRAQERERGRSGDVREKEGREGSRKERKEGQGVEKVDGKPTGEPVNENYGLGHGAVDKHGKKPWYALKSFMVDRAKDDVGERPDKRLRITGRVDHGKSKAKKKTIEELRAERMKREQEEKHKVRKLQVTKSTGYERLPNGRMPQYHGSYGNAR